MRDRGEVCMLDAGRDRVARLLAHLASCRVTVWTCHISVGCVLTISAAALWFASAPQAQLSATLAPHPLPAAGPRSLCARSMLTPPPTAAGQRQRRRQRADTHNDGPQQGFVLCSGQRGNGCQVGTTAHGTCCSHVNQTYAVRLTGHALCVALASGGYNGVQLLSTQTAGRKQCLLVAPLALAGSVSIDW
jgi:hypothetical protein